MVVITGASSGLGEALASAFYRGGCKVVLVDQQEADLERIRLRLTAERPKDVPIYQPDTVSADLTDLAGIPEKVTEILEECGQIDILINNASLSARSDVLSTDINVDVRVMNVNYFGTVALTKGTLDFLREINS